jgi:hypothetical protein
LKLQLRNVVAMIQGTYRRPHIFTSNEMAMIPVGMTPVKHDENNLAHAKFWDLFTPPDNRSAYMPKTWQQDLSHYLFFGLTPGSFHSSLYANDLFGATSMSHPSNEWEWIQAFMYFLFHHAPIESWGSRAKVKAWLKLSEQERFELCHDKGLVMTDEEVTWHILASNELK